MSRARHKKAGGGKVGSETPFPYNAVGSNVEKEAAERKSGGRTKHVKAEGGKPKSRLDKFRRGGRAMGGRTGADKHPLSSAAKVHHVGSDAGAK